MMKISRVEQDYIKAIYEQQIINNQDIVTLKQIADRLHVSAPTVTEMIKRLERKELVVYKSYKGVYLSELGMREGRFILKSHRIWELFLLEYLGYQENEVHQEAENLEHAASPMMIERLSTFLGNPKYCPHGNEIPQESFWYEQKQQLSLDLLAIGTRAECVEIPETSRALLELLEIGSLPKFVTVRHRMVDGAIIAEFDGGRCEVIPTLYQKNWLVALYQK
jgi:Mn-dependent transcriptional regulator